MMDLWGNPGVHQLYNSVEYISANNATAKAPPDASTLSAPRNTTKYMYFYNIIIVQFQLYPKINGINKYLISH